MVMIRQAPPLEKLGSRIRELRQQKSLSQEEFAQLAELDRSYIGQIERGERNISFNNLVRIADAFDISLSDILEGI